MGLTADLASLFFPPQCHICGDRLEGDVKFICPFCREALPRTSYHNSPFNPMERRLIPFTKIERATGVFFYTPATKISQLVQDFKYRHFPSLAIECGKIIGSELQGEGFFNGVDFLMPVPMFWFKKMRRGYNQTELIAEGISRITNIPVSCKLKSIKPHSTQTGLDHEARRKNVEGKFILKDAGSFSRKHIMLVDDICTTGSTLVSAASAILSAQPYALVSAVTFGVTHQ